MDLSLEQLEEVITSTRVVFSDCCSDGSSYYEGSLDGSPRRYFPGPDGARTSPGRDERAVMTDKDKTIYNSLGSSSSSRGKVKAT